MQKIDTYRYAIFDCDGVILDSNKLKSDAFAESLRGEETHLIEEFVQYHKANGGVSRYVKFAHFFEIIKKEPNAQEKVQNAIEKYAHLSYEGILSCPEIAGIRTFLRHLNSNKINCFVVSGGDENELNAAFKERELDKYFVKILGSPNTKTQNLESLMTKHYLSLPAIYFGDSLSDLQAAEAYNIDFVYVASKSEWSQGRTFCQSKNIPIIENFNEILV